MKKCFECETAEDLQEHHVVPRSRGGTKTVTLCYECHRKAHGSDGKGVHFSNLMKEVWEKRKQKDPDAGKNAMTPKAREISIKRRKRTADEFALKLAPLVMTEETLQVVADKLMTYDIKTRRGGNTWNPSQVSNLRKRIKLLKEE